jgi:hypothetical protein
MGEHIEIRKHVGNRYAQIIDAGISDDSKGLLRGSRVTKPVVIEEIHE